MQTAADVSAPEIVIKLGEREMNARFDHNQMRYAELYWQHTTRGVLGYMGIMDQMVHRTYCGMGAICYGAVASAAIAAEKEPLAMDAFDQRVDYEALMRVQPVLLKSAFEALPRKRISEKKAERRA